MRVRQSRPAGPSIHHWLSILFLALPLLFLAVFFFYPLANILQLGFSSEAAREILSRQYYLSILWFTLWQAALSTILTLLIGLPAAYLFSHYTFPTRSLLKALTAAPFVMPTVVVAAAFRALFGPTGPLNELLMRLLNLESPPVQLEQTLSIILLAHVFYNTTIVIRLVGGMWSHLSPRQIEAARLLGAGRWRAFYEVTLPQLLPALLSAALLIFLFTFTSFGVILILGGPAFSTLETEIYRQYVTFLRPDVAAILSLLQILITFVVMLFYSRWQARSSRAQELRGEESNLRRPESGMEKLLVAALVVFLYLFLVTPLAALVWRSLTDRQGNLTLDYYLALPELRRGSVLFVSPLVAIRNSLSFAVLTMFLAVFLGLASSRLLVRPAGRAGWRHYLDPVFMLPLGVSAVTLGLGYVVTFSALRTSVLLVLIAHTLVAFPFVVRSVLPVMQAIRPNLREAAALLGASSNRVWREVDLPIVGRALLVAAMFAFTVSMGEFGATSFIVRPNSDFSTMPVAIARYMGQPGALNFGQAMAMGTILMTVCAAGFIAIERFRYSDIGEF